jgi:hypothetical protein
MHVRGSVSGALLVCSGLDIFAFPLADLLEKLITAIHIFVAMSQPSVRARTVRLCCNASTSVGGR